MPATCWRSARFYRCDRSSRHVECFAKQLWDGDWNRPAGLGCFYALLTKMLWPSGEGNEGKVMGLAPFGDPDAHGLPDLDVRGHEVFIPDEWLKAFQERDRYTFFSGVHGSAAGSADGAARFADCANLAAAGQRAFENALLLLADWLHEQTGLDQLCFAAAPRSTAQRTGCCCATPSTATCSSRRARTMAAPPWGARCMG